MHNAADFAEQKPVEFNFLGYQMTVPSGSFLLGYFDPKSPIHEPYRDAGIIKIAQALEGRTGIAIDIGANVGDTCAILHRHTGLKIACVDASDFFFRYLTDNVERCFKDRATTRHAFVVSKPGEAAKGLYHWGGTARPTDAAPTEACGTITVPELLALGDVAFFKSDTDGLDVEIIVAVFRHCAPRFPIFFEYELAGATRDAIAAHVNGFLEVLHTAASAGYRTAFVWDARGRFYGLLDLRQPESFINAVNYLGHGKDQSVWNYDICLVHQTDFALVADLRALVSRDTVMPLPGIWTP